MTRLSLASHHAVHLAEMGWAALSPWLAVLAMFVALGLVGTYCS